MYNITKKEKIRTKNVTFLKVRTKNRKVKQNY